MTIYVVYSGGSGATGTASSMTPSSGEWNAAYTKLKAATDAATSADTILVAHDHSESQTTALTITLPTTPGLRILAINRSTGALEPKSATVAVGAGNVALNVNGMAYIFGLKFLAGTNASASCNLALANAPSIDHAITLDSGLLQLRSTSAVKMLLGPGASASHRSSLLRLVNTELWVGASTHTIVPGGRLHMIGVSTEYSGTAASTLFTPANATDAEVTVDDSDLSDGWSYLVNVAAQAALRFDFAHCRFPASWATVVGTFPGPGGAEIFINDCHGGDVHGAMRHYTPMGNAVSEFGTYVTDGAAKQSWAISTTSLCSPQNPYRTPWVGRWRSASGAVQPYIEVLRNNDSTTAYTDAEVWAEGSIKSTSGYPLGTPVSDGISAIATPANQDAGAGTAAWAGNTAGYSWSGKLVLPSTTPAEDGEISMRVCVGLTSMTAKLFVDPQVRV